MCIRDRAHFEAERCLSCGNCFECDGCLGACPEDAIIKLGEGHRYQFDYDKCTGCGACAEQCPVHAIQMIPEDTLIESIQGAGNPTAGWAVRPTPNPVRSAQAKFKLVEKN